MTKELKEEVEEQIYKEVRFGFDEPSEILEGILDMFYNEKEIDKDWIIKEIDLQYNTLQEESKNWNSPTDFDKLVEIPDKENWSLTRSIITMKQNAIKKQSKWWKFW